MIRSLTLENFLAHEHTVVELGPRLTVLTGPNNSGKSAVVEGLRCLATNPAPKYFIRHGAKEARVEAELEDGVRVAWIRTKTHARYEVTRPGQDEPDTYAKFGRTPPEDVLDLLRLDPVPLESNPNAPVDVHIGDQRRPIFLLDQSGFAIASFFASSTESSHLLAMQRLLKEKVRLAKRKRQELEGEQGALRIRLDRLEGLPGAQIEAVEARRAFTQSRELAAHFPVIEQILSRERRLFADMHFLKARLDRLDRLAAPGVLWPCPRLEDTLGRLARLEGETAVETGRKEILARLEAPPRCFDVQALARIGLGIVQGGRRSMTIRNRVMALEGLEEPPALQETSALRGVLAEEERLGAEERRFAEKARALESLAAPSTAEETAPLDRTLSRLRELEAKARKAAGDLETRDTRLGALRKRIAARLGEIGACPLCGSSLDPEAFLEGGCCP